MTLRLADVCGRLVAATLPERVAALLRVDAVVPEAAAGFRPRWNVAPTDPVLAVAESGSGERLLGSFRWGLVPPWADRAAVGARMINVRAETAARKFGAALARRRCLVPVDGFYEWQRRPDGTRQAWFIQRVDGQPMVLAGLWERWRDPAAPGGEALTTCTIITCAANQAIETVHDRMPVLLDGETWDPWLDRQISDPAAVVELLAPADAAVVGLHPVSPRVNSVRNDGPDLVAPVPGDQPSAVAAKRRSSTSPA